ncbi:MAG: hypothetical protein NPIRA01_17070 [Nitrospirales bacterium]|nr:MAG: hypothetical protein NPIRA01_17070 [Nitrospirales bacterium]
MLILLSTYSIYLLVLTLMPFTFSFDSSWKFLDLASIRFEPLAAVVCCTPIEEIVGNVLLFAPFGFLLSILPACRCRSQWSRLIIVVCFACLVSVLIEYSQIFLPRAPSIADVFLNSIGGTLGAVAGSYGYDVGRRYACRVWANLQKSPMVLWLFLVYVMALFDLTSLSILGTDFRNWDPSYPFQLGNEASGDRPWLGKLYFVALYDNVLTAKEVQRHFHSGPFQRPSQKGNRNGPVALYSFTEGRGTTVQDRSGFEPPLDLSIGDREKISWIAPQGVELLASTSITSAGPAQKLCLRHMCSRSQLSVEVWVEPENLEQAGPARILSYSANTLLRNFTLGQDGKNIIFRLRTPLSGLNGIHPALQTTDDPLIEGRHHIVVTYRVGYFTLFVDGRKHAILTVDGRDHLTLFYSVGKWAFWSVALFPIGFLAYIIFSRLVRSVVTAIIFSLVIGFVVLLGVELVSWAFVNREIDVPLLLSGTGVIFLSALTSSTFDKATAVH